jgi:hypothetical protein
MSTGLPLTELSRPARELRPEDFAVRHGPAFLVHHGPLRPSITEADGRTIAVESAASPTSAIRRTKAADFVVFPLLSSGRSAFAGYVWVGRAANNDVVIADGTISEAHAYFQHRPTGWCLQDAGSKNGTFVDDEVVPGQKGGPPVTVSSGARVRLGHVNLMFLMHTELIQLARRLI